MNNTALSWELNRCLSVSKGDTDDEKGLKSLKNSEAMVKIETD